MVYAVVLRFFFFFFLRFVGNLCWDCFLDQGLKLLDLLQLLRVKALYSRRRAKAVENTNSWWVYWTMHVFLVFFFGKKRKLKIERIHNIPSKSVSTAHLKKQKSWNNTHYWTDCCYKNQTSYITSYISM